MIYAVARPIKEYGTVIEGTAHGLYTTYIHDPPLLAMVMICTIHGYDYEGTGVPPELAAAALKDIQPLRDALSESINSVKIREHIARLTPLEFAELVETADLSNWEIVKGMYAGDQELFKGVVKARAVTWALNHRGRIESKGKVIKVAFNNKHLRSGISEEMLKNHYEIKERVKNVRQKQLSISG